MYYYCISRFYYGPSANTLREIARESFIIRRSHTVPRPYPIRAPSVPPAAKTTQEFCKQNVLSTRRPFCVLITPSPRLRAAVAITHPSRTLSHSSSLSIPLSRSPSEPSSVSRPPAVPPTPLIFRILPVCVRRVYYASDTTDRDILRIRNHQHHPPHISVVSANFNLCVCVCVCMYTRTTWFSSIIPGVKRWIKDQKNKNKNN